MKVNVVIETPKGSAEKYNYDPTIGMFKLKKILPAGMAFPFDFGFIPNTKGDDGDPLDVMVISEFKTFPGCLMECRIIGAILAAQTEKSKTIRNDRFIGIPVVSELFKHVSTIDQLTDNLVAELKEFFINYNRIEGKKFKPLKLIKPAEAARLIKNYSGDL